MSGTHTGAWVTPPIETRLYSGSFHLCFMQSSLSLDLASPFANCLLGPGTWGAFRPRYWATKLKPNSSTWIDLDAAIHTSITTFKPCKDVPFLCYTKHRFSVAHTLHHWPSAITGWRHLVLHDESWKPLWLTWYTNFNVTINQISSVVSRNKFLRIEVLVCMLECLAQSRGKLWLVNTSL